MAPFSNQELCFSQVEEFSLFVNDVLNDSSGDSSKDDPLDLVDDLDVEVLKNTLSNPSKSAAGYKRYEDMNQDYCSLRKTEVTGTDVFSKKLA